MDSLIGQHLGQYDIIAKIGAGGMATVYRARQSSIDRDVAIKVIRADLLNKVSFAERFQREARMIASLSHLHILKVFDYGQAEDFSYLVMELIDGGSLATLIEHSGTLPLETTNRLLSQMSQALDYAHQRGIIHRDLKPENVLLDKFQNAFLTDFGIAKLITETTTLTQTGTVMGTPAYMAPEVWSGQPADARTDVYALGVILFQMMVGKLPFRADTPYRIMHMHIYEQAPSLRTFNTKLPPAFDKVLEGALAKDREQRFSSAGDLYTAFQAAVQGKPVTRTVAKAATTGKAANTKPKAEIPDDRTEISPSVSSPLIIAARNTAVAQQPPRSRLMIPLVIIALLLLILGIGAAIVYVATNPGPVAVVKVSSPMPTLQQSPTIASSGNSSQVAVIITTPTLTFSPTIATTIAPSATVLPTMTSTTISTTVPTDIPTLTPTVTSSDTPIPPTVTPTNTPIPPTDTPTTTPTNQVVGLTPDGPNPATLVASTLGPILTGTAQSVSIQQTVGAILTAQRQNAVQTQASLDNDATRVAFAATTAYLAQQAVEVTAALPPTATDSVQSSITCPGFLPSRLTVGKFALVTPGDPNRIRVSPSLSARVVGQIPGGSQFMVLEGPICADGMAWWGLTYNGVGGWTAEGQDNSYWLEPAQ